MSNHYSSSYRRDAGKRWSKTAADWQPAVPFWAPWVPPQGCAGIASPVPHPTTAQDTANPFLSKPCPAQ